MTRYTVKLGDATTEENQGGHQKPGDGTDTLSRGEMGTSWLFAPRWSTFPRLFDALADILAPTVACRFYGLAEVNGVEAFKQMAPAFAASFSESWFTIDTIIAEDDWAAIHYTWRGTHQGEYPGMAATGKQVTETGTRFYRIKGGKIVQMWGDENVLGLL